MVYLEHSPLNFIAFGIKLQFTIPVPSIKHFQGIYGEHDFPFRDIDVHVEPLRQRSEVYNFEITEHLHSRLIQVFFLEQGGGILISEGREITMTAPCLILIPSGILHGFVWKENIAGTVITASNAMYDRYVVDHQKITGMFHELQYLDFENDLVRFEQFKTIIREISTELKNNIAGKEYALHLLVQFLFLQIHRKHLVSSQISISSKDRSLVHFNAFQKLLSNEPRNIKSVKEYAKMLNITSVHLNRICNALVQKSALKIIHERIASEARKMLLYTELSIGQISYDLHFKDPSHFSKFMTKTMGESPKHIRKDIHKNK